MTAVAPETAGKKQGRGRFKPGQSGNPAGRPVGARNKATVAVEALLDGEAETLTRQALGLAAAGDPAMVRFCLDRIAPARKDRPVPFTLPKLRTVADAIEASSMLVEAAAAGELTPTEAAGLGQLVAGFHGIAEKDELQRRIEAIEAQLKSATP